MSFKRRFQFQLQSFVDTIKTIDLPEWASSKMARTTLTVVAIFLSVGYIVKTSSLAITGYEINKLETKTNVLNGEIKQLETQAADSGSLSSVKSRLGEVKMVIAGDIKYVGGVGSVVAVK